MFSPLCSVRTGWRDARVRKPGRPRPHDRSRPASSKPQDPCRPRCGAAPPPLRPAGCGRGGRQRCQRGNRCGPREAEVVPGTTGPAPDASAMDASLEKVGTEGSGGAAVPGLRHRDDWFPRGTKECRRRRVSDPGLATSRGSVAEGRWARRCRSRPWLHRGSAWGRA